MKKQYDIVFLEPSYWPVSHSEYDIQCLAELFSFLGYKVLVVVITKSNFHDKKKYDVLHIQDRKNYPDIEYIRSERNKIILFLKRIILDFRRFRYFRKILRELTPFANNFYIGVLTVNILPIILSLPPSKTHYFLWGIRSYYFSKDGILLQKNPYIILKAFLLKYLIKNDKKYSLFVSNHFIAKEFIALGIKNKNILLRPERMLKNTSPTYYNKLSLSFSILTIGSIRASKRIELAIASLDPLNIPYTIAGKTSNSYAEKIDKLISSLAKPNIIRVSKYLTDNEYINLIHTAHFVLICDKADLSTSSNGTFLDALLRCRPVIVPDREPFRYYIQKYGIGLMFVDGDKYSLRTAIQKANSLGTQFFTENILKFQEDYLL